MSMSTHVCGFRPPDEKWKHHKAVWEACKAAKVPVPKETEEFFDYGAPDEHGVAIAQAVLERCGSAREWSDGDSWGFEIDISKLPEDVTVLRFWNAC